MVMFDGWQFGEVVEICLRFENEILCEEIIVTEWVQLEFVVVAGKCFRRKPRLPEINFTHVEVEEEIPPGIVETVEEILAESLFRLWLSEKGIKNERNEESRCVHS